MDLQRNFINSAYEKIRYANHSGTSNCFGGTCHLIGEKGKDEYVGLNEMVCMLNKLSKADIPELGYVVVWRDDEGKPYHSALITGLEDSIRLATRNGKGKSIYPNQKFAITHDIVLKSMEEEGKKFGELNYFIPSKLNEKYGQN